MIRGLPRLGSPLSRRAFLQRGGAAVALTLGSRRALATADAEPPHEMPRWVLALYKSDEMYDAVEGRRPKNATLNEIHQWAQMPLNWLGLMVDYHDISQGLPADSAMGRYRGIVTWFQSLTMDDPLAYLNWLGRQIRVGRRVVILGTLGAFLDRRRQDLDPDRIAEALQPTGLDFRGNSTMDQRLVEVRFRDPQMVGFERSLPAGLPNYYQVRSRRPENRSHLVVARRDLADSASHLVVTGPWGGFASDAYVRTQAAIGHSTPADHAAARASEVRYVSQWLVNPFAFFRDALGVADWPRPDVTTLNGRRIAYSHIDGDGMRNVSEVRPRALSGEIVRDEILARYPLPITVSVVAAEVAPDLLGSPRTAALARQMFALPNVEAGSHSFFHPLDWEKRTRSFDVPGRPFSLETETAGSVKYIDERLVPAGKRVALFQWSGSTRVTEDAIAALDRLGMPNINGGDSMYDAQWPTYTRVAPLMRQVGRTWQTYTSASNENLYTNLWTGPFYGFRYAIDTFRNTGSPRRVSPINVYYHFYSGERIAALRALREVYDWVLRQPVAPLYTSEYVAMVTGFRTARIGRVTDGWRVWDHGALRTIRLDESAAEVDLARCHGVLGASRHAGGFYVHLAGPEPATIVLRRSAAPALSLMSASHRVLGWSAAGGAVAFRMAGVGAKSAEVGGLPAGREVTVAVTDGRGARTERVRVGRDGVAALALGDAGSVEVRVR